MIIVLYPQQSHAVYIDSGNARRKDYTNITGVLDQALTSSTFRICRKIKTQVIKDDKAVFGHKFEFPCVKQPENSTKDASTPSFAWRREVRSRRSKIQ
jgi:hypothetical protein